MNWTNFDRLVDRLQTMPPDAFHYSQAWMDGPFGCVACQCRHLDASISLGGSLAVHHEIERFLDIDVDDAFFLYCGTHPEDPYRECMRGEKGIANALHRLQVVASKYTRPAISVPSQDFSEREREFLKSCMAVASEPVE